MKSRFLFSAFLAMGMFLSSAASAAQPVGVYLGPGCNGVNRLPQYTAWLGRSPDYVLEFGDMRSWDNLINSAKWALGCWKPTNLPLTFSVPMLPKADSGQAQLLRKGARGQYGAYFKELAGILVQYGYGNAHLRVGWEMNGNWYIWSAFYDPKSWVSFYKRIVTTMKSVSGANFEFVWNGGFKDQVQHDA